MKEMGDNMWEAFWLTADGVIDEDRKEESVPIVEQYVWPDPQKKKAKKDKSKA